MSDLTRTHKEEAAFYESGLVARGCLENIDDYMDEAITKYGRILAEQRNLMSELVEGIDTLRDKREQDQLKEYAHIVDMQKEEIERLRKVISQIATNLGNGACVSEKASIGFIETLPREVKLVCDELRSKLKCAQTKLNTH